jgi:hypothetical protein
MLLNQFTDFWMKGGIYGHHSVELCASLVYIQSQTDNSAQPMCWEAGSFRLVVVTPLKIQARNRSCKMKVNMVVNGKVWPVHCLSGVWCPHRQNPRFAGALQHFPLANLLEKNAHIFADLTWFDYFWPFKGGISGIWMVAKKLHTKICSPCYYFLFWTTDSAARSIEVAL